MASVRLPLLGRITLAGPGHHDHQALMERRRRPSTAAGAPPDQGVGETAHAIRRRW
ncbi:hypothetical protein [Streptomyces venezuelae]|uniref:hypothetical protein n=1 Tax=Streptomyces venezuelae TaxID=54571 RepID=UPI00331CAF68